jgi:hypothetical protein
MRKDILNVKNLSGGENVPLFWIHTLIIGSGAAGLNSAVQLVRNGINDVMILYEFSNWVEKAADFQPPFCLSGDGDCQLVRRMSSEKDDICQSHFKLVNVIIPNTI